ncbi:hypothetical protein F511_32568 [Dorcoceras hygrometricum]|uniref:Uncharacterized protein n=1 Tax=Dorcoceras hygrometricum TaxID=472368 RepID=A0A2Z7BFY5_9LAMI|nr:hypothetical protein F511_32568 [Dorcoceras hygrometricum]
MELVGARRLDVIKAPGSDQFHERIGPSKVERLDQCLIRSTTGISTPSLFCTRKPTKIRRTKSPCQYVRNKFRQQRQTMTDDDGVDDGNGGGE